MTKLPWPGNTLLPNVPHETYHSDPWGDVPCLSQSVAAELVKCPLLGWAAHPRLGGAIIGADKPTADMETGNLLHALVLGSGPRFVSLDFKDYKTNAARGAKEEAIASGLVPVLTHKFEAAQEAATAIIRAVREQEGIEIGEYDAEVTALWTDPNLGVRCRGRFDLQSGYSIVDPKFTNLEPHRWIAGMEGQGYDIQASAYIEALETIHPEYAGRVEFTFLLIRPTWPHTTCRVTIGGTSRSLGEDRWHRAKLSWQTCLRAGRWPSYSPVTAEATSYQLQRELERAIETVEEEYGR